MELAERKANRLCEYDYSTAGAYFVTLCTQNRQKILSPTLGTVIGWYKYQVTKQINLQLGGNGERIFQRSYYDHVIRNQRDHDEIWQYIENKPRK